MRTQAKAKFYAKWLALILAAAAFEASAETVQTVPGRIRLISFTEAVAPGDPSQIKHLNRFGRSFDYTVPTGTELVLTDFIIAPQAEVPEQGKYHLQVLARNFSAAGAPVLASGFGLEMNSSDPSSFQVHLNSGMVVPAGYKIEVWLHFGPAPIEINAFGYLVAVP